MTYEQLAARVTAKGETAGRRYALLVPVWEEAGELDRKSTRLNSSH